MSNFCDIRIKLGCESEEVASGLFSAIKKTVSKVCRKDVNAGVPFGSDYFRFIWPYARQNKNDVNLTASCRVGIENIDVIDLINWFKQYASNFELQVREDNSRIFALYKWRKSDEHSLFIKWLPYDNFPKLGNPNSDSYDKDTIMKLHAAIKNNGETLVMSFDNIVKQTLDRESVAN